MTDIGQSAQKDETGDVYYLLATNLVDAPGLPDVDGSSGNMRVITWTRDGVTVSLRRTLNTTTHVVISDRTYSIFRLQ